MKTVLSLILLTFVTPLLLAADAELKVEIKDVKEQPALVIRVTKVKQADIGKELGVIYPKVMQYLTAHKIEVSGPPFARYLKSESDVFDIEAGFPVPVNTKGEGEIVASPIPACKAAFTTHVGPYEKLRETYDKLKAWLAANKHEMGGAPWEVYISDPGDTKPDALKTDVYMPVK